MPAKDRQKADRLTISRALRLVGLGDLSVSEDGARVAYVRSVVQRGRKTRASEIWAAGAGLPAPRCLTRGPDDGQPRWSPDGETLAFTRKLDEGTPPQVLLLPVDGGEPRQLGDLRVGPEGLCFLPDGKRLSFLSPAPDSKAVAKRKSEGDDAHVVCEDDKPKLLWTLSLKSGKPKPVSPDDYSIWEYDWLPDGSHAAVIYTDEHRVDAQYFRARLGILDAVAGTLQPLEVPVTFLHGPKVSADGATIALLGSGDGAPHGGEAWTVDTARGQATCLTPNLAGSAMTVGFLGRSSTLLIQVGEGFANALYTVSIDAPGKLHRVCGALPPALDAVAVSPDGSRLCAVGQAAAEPPEVWQADIADGQVTRLTDENASPRKLSLGKRSVVSWHSEDGLAIEGGLVLPPGHKAGAPAPAILLVHGGPAGRFREDFGLLPAQLLAAAGYVVLMPNPRGSSGYGEAFVNGNFRDWGGGDFRDLMAGVDWLIAEGLADPARLGIYGGSYGGYMTAWAVTQTDRFKAAVCQCGLSNLYSFHAQTDITPGFLELYLGCSPYDQPERYWDRSAMKHQANVRTPTLFLHGEQDVRVPIEQSYELFWALRHRGVETQLVTYPREGHGIGEVAHQKDLYERVLAWFKERL